MNCILGYTVGEVFQPSDQFCGPPLDPIPTDPSLSCAAPEPDAGLQGGSHQGGAEGQNPLPCPAGHAAVDAAQFMVGLLGCESTLLGDVELLISQHPKVLLFRAALSPFSG